MRYQQSAQKTQDRRAHNIGEVMRAQVHPRKGNEDRNGKAGQADAPSGKN